MIGTKKYSIETMRKIGTNLLQSNGDEDKSPDEARTLRIKTELQYRFSISNGILPQLRYG